MTRRLTRRAVPEKQRNSANREKLIILTVLWLYAAISISPLLVIILGSVRSTSELLTNPVGLPSHLTAANYTKAWTDGNFSAYLVNSILVTTLAVVLCTGVSTMIAYPLGRWQFRGRGVLAAFLLSGLLLPVRLGAVPMYGLFQNAGLIDSRTSLVLVYAAMGIPLAVFVSTAFFRHMPTELEEAARVDGAGELRLFWSVMLPLARPAMGTVAAITFVSSWDDFFFPLILLRSPEKFTVTVGLSNFVGQYNTDIGPLFAGLVLAICPVILLFIIASRQIVSGLTAGIGK